VEFEYGWLQWIGRPMQMVDFMIAAIDLSLGNCTLNSTDNTLVGMPEWAFGNSTA
jgi:hypothetical protein